MATTSAIATGMFNDSAIFSNGVPSSTKGLVIASAYTVALPPSTTACVASSISGGGRIGIVGDHNLTVDGHAMHFCRVDRIEGRAAAAGGDVPTGS